MKIKKATFYFLGKSYFPIHMVTSYFLSPFIRLDRVMEELERIKEAIQHNEGRTSLNIPVKGAHEPSKDDSENLERERELMERPPITPTTPSTTARK